VAERLLRVAFLIRALTAGGAERQLALLARGLAARGHEVSVLVFYGGSALESDLERSTVRIVNLRKNGRWDVVAFARRLIAALDQSRAQVLYSFWPTANILAALVRPAARSIPLAWGIRASDMQSHRYDWLGRLIAALEARLSRAAQMFVCNSRAGARVAAKQGFDVSRIRVIRNGVDTSRFRRDEAARLRLREEWGVTSAARLIGFVGRIDPMKGHRVFLQAAARVHEREPRTTFVIAGGTREQTAQLRDQAEALGVGQAVRWSESRSDMPAFYSALDVLCSASLYGEGTSNVIAEAMSCGCPCVATDVGDSAELIGDLGRVVPPGNPVLLAEALLDLPHELQPAERQRIREHIAGLCDIESLVLHSEALLRDLVNGATPGIERGNQAEGH
jgi:glycosyltransferase involved in cell wall biosynthesis